MNIVFVIDNPALFRSFEKTFRYLCALGHQVKVLYDHYDRPHIVDRALKACQAELSNFEAMPMLSRRKWLRLSNVREMVDYANYLRPRHPTPWEARRWRRKIIFKPISKALKYSKIANKLLANNGIFLMLKWMQRLIPPDQDILRWLKTNRPDVVVSSPYILPRTSEIEYIQAARALQIPTIAIVLSWDNLTTKGTFHIIPDAVFVWNDALAKEATSLHDVPPDKIFITGAPVFDFWFEMQPSLDSHSFCSKAGISADQAFVLYLCSSKYISGDETSFVKAFAKALRNNPDTRNISVLVRPHPLNATIWNGFEDENIAVWPKEASWVDTEEVKQDYYNSIYHSAAVVGVNTSAFLEAAILDKPCVTILTEQYRSKQSERGHFRHLLKGNFLEVTHSFSESASVIAGILAGKDSKKEQRQRFVRDFIRPHGLDRYASEIMAKTIESTALRRDIQQYRYN
ncbi:MAG: CDP-glycerol glycerophosphotransferase family protein [Desulfobacterales bacterium]|nr:MAG: CDP-glycerol glycerophosphotransferase family protein [Desulfobacterales bacterium]